MQEVGCLYVVFVLYIFGLSVSIAIISYSIFLLRNNTEMPPAPQAAVAAPQAVVAAPQSAAAALSASQAAASGKSAERVFFCLSSHTHTFLRTMCFMLYFIWCFLYFILLIFIFLFLFYNMVNATLGTSPCETCKH